MLEPEKVKIAVATVTKTHGIKGEMNIELTDFAEPDDDFAPGACLIVEIEGLDVPFFVASSRPRGPESMLLMLDDVNSEAEATSLCGHSLYVYTDETATDGDELTAGELIGYTIIDADSGNPVGKVSDLKELTPGSWYFVTEPDDRLIPAVDEMILSVDSDRRAIEMRLPEGLLEL